MDSSPRHAGMVNDAVIRADVDRARLWHEHGHDGNAPVVWLEVPDLPLVGYKEPSDHINGQRQTQLPGRGDRAYSRCGMVPTPVFGRSAKAYPMLRYPWVEADTCCAPGCSAVTLRNRDAAAPGVVHIADERPQHRKLGVFENRG